MAVSPARGHSDDARPDVLTRRELLEMRGYEPEVVNGNGRPPGSTVLVAETRNAPPVTPPAPTEPSTVEPGADTPSCSQCDQPAKPGRPTCGRAECVAGHKRERKRRDYATSANGSGWAARRHARATNAPAGNGNATPAVPPPPAATEAETSVLEQLAASASRLPAGWWFEGDHDRLTLTFTAAR
jgi:hypothetical protein